MYLVRTGSNLPFSEKMLWDRPILYRSIDPVSCPKPPQASGQPSRECHSIRSTFPVMPEAALSIRTFSPIMPDSMDTSSKHQGHQTTIHQPKSILIAQAPRLFLRRHPRITCSLGSSYYLLLFTFTFHVLPFSLFTVSLFTVVVLPTSFAYKRRNPPHVFGRL